MPNEDKKKKKKKKTFPPEVCLLSIEILMLGIPGLTYYQPLKLASALKKNHCQNTIFLSKINRMLDNELILLAPDLQVSQNELDLNKKTEQSLED